MRIRRGRPEGRAPAPSGPAREPLLRGAATLVSGRLVVAALGFGATILVVRTLSPTGWGQFTFIFGLLYLVSALSDLGVGRVALAGVMDEAADPARFAGAYVGLRAALGVAGYAIAVGIAAAAGYPGVVVAGTAIAGVVLVLATISHALDVVFQARHRLSVPAIAQVVGQLAQVALVAALAARGAGLLLFMLPAVLFEVVALAYRITRLEPGLRPRPAVALPVWGRLLRDAAPLSVGLILATALFRIDVVMLSALDSFPAVGVYGIATKFVDLAHFAPSAVTTAALPILVATWAVRPEAFAHTVRRAATVLALVGALFLVEFGLFAEDVIRLLYGDEYAVGALATQLVVTGEVLAFFGALGLAVLVASGRTRAYPIAGAVGVGMNVGLNFWLIPSRSYEGAAIATLATEAVVTALLLFVTLRAVGRGPLPSGDLPRVALAGLAAAGAGFLVERVAPWPVAAVAAALTLVALAHLARVGGPGGLRDLGRASAVPSAP